jgi:hypothetical protein
MDTIIFTRLSALQAAIIGLAPPPLAPAVDFTAISNVLIIDGNHPLTRREAALRLGCKLETLNKRLRKYRVTGRQVRVRFYDLQMRNRPPC